MKKPRLINIISGKGGAGKSLLCATLGRLLAQEESHVLLVDFDIFVRGLTHFYCRYMDEEQSITDDTSVAEYFALPPGSGVGSTLSKERFFELQLLPAVSRIDAQIDYMKVSDELIRKAQEFFITLKEQGEYDFIIIDNHAGLDEIVIETSRASDITLSVSEGDSISQDTNGSLLNYLHKEKAGRIYTIMNKVRFLRSFDDYSKTLESIGSDFSILGQIPFDVDLFEAFGTVRFWDKANSTKYAFGLSDCWNKLAKREKLDVKIDLNRFSKSEIWTVSPRIPTFTNRADRMMLFLGLVMIVGYLGYDVVLHQRFNFQNLFLVYAIALFAFPFLRRIVFPQDE